MLNIEPHHCQPNQTLLKKQCMNRRISRFFFLSYFLLFMMIATQQPTAISNIHYVEKQEEDNHVVLIVVVVLTSRQPKNYRLFPIVFIYFVTSERMVRFWNKSNQFDSNANP